MLVVFSSHETIYCTPLSPYIYMYVYGCIYRSSTKVLSFRSQKGTIDRGASFQHMNILQRIVSEQWYPAECRQRVPTAKSVLKTLSKSVHVPTYVPILCVHTYALYLHA